MAYYEIIMVKDFKYSYTNNSPNNKSILLARAVQLAVLTRYHHTTVSVS